MCLGTRLDLKEISVLGRVSVVVRVIAPLVMVYAFAYEACLAAVLMALSPCAQTLATALILPRRFLALPLVAWVGR